MDLFEVIERRRTIRRYRGPPVSREHIRRIVWAGTRASNAGNRQMWQFVAVSNREMIARMADLVEEAIRELTTWPAAQGMESKILSTIGYSTFFKDAPLVIAAFMGEYRTATDELFIKAGCDKETHDRLRGCPGIQSVAAALAHMQLAADALGYGSCWQSGPVVAASEIEELLGLRGVAQLVALLSVGIPAEEPPPRPRRALEDVLQIID